LEFAEPEWSNSPVIDQTGAISGTVRIYRTTECCGDEAKESELDVDAETPQDVVDAHTGDGHELFVDEPQLEQVEEGGGRYAKSYFGASCEFEVRCSCQKSEDEPLATVGWSDRIAASHMDEML
jgi:hypothetical protein